MPFLSVEVKGSDVQLAVRAIAPILATALVRAHDSSRSRQASPSPPDISGAQQVNGRVSPHVGDHVQSPDSHQQLTSLLVPRTSNGHLTTSLTPKNCDILQLKQVSTISYPTFLSNQFYDQLVHIWWFNGKQMWPCALGADCLCLGCIARSIEILMLQFQIWR